MTEHYGSDPLQTYRVFNYTKAIQSIVFIHGGAWRDPNNTFDDFSVLAEYISSKSNVNVFGINYRLSPQVKHPAHLEDVDAAIKHIIANYEVGDLVIAGHSVGATLILQLLRQFPKLNLKGAVYIDGIYDIKELVDEYPSYQGFVSEAFVNEEDYTVLTGTEGGLEKTHSTLIIQSNEDELLSPRQSELFSKYLDAYSIKHTYLKGDWGAHEEVYKNKAVGDLICQLL